MNLVESFGKSMYKCMNDSMTDTLDCIFKNFIDSFPDGTFGEFDTILKDFPVLGYFISAKNMFLTIRDRFFIKKTLKFFSELHKGEINQQEIEGRIQALENKEDWIYDEIELLISTIERFDREEKSRILSEIYRAYLNKEIKKFEFDDFCSITERLFLSDIIQIRSDYEYKEREERYKMLKIPVNYKEVYTEITGRLLALGLMCISAEVNSKIRYRSNLLEYKVSQKGERYAEILSRINFLDILSGIIVNEEL